MTGGPDAEWELVREFGIDYAGHDVDSASIALAFPVAAEKCAGGGYLIVDDAASDGMPLHMRCRTLLLAPNGRLVFDSQASGIDNGYGCLIDDRHVAVLDCARRELAVLAREGDVLKRIDLSGISRHQPRLCSRTFRGTFVVVFSGYIEEVAFAELDLDGRVLWSIGGTRPAVGIAGSVQLLNNDSLLIADEFHNVVWEADRDGAAAVRRGRFHAASAADDRLHRPRCARLLEDGALLIADTHNHRVQVVDGSNRAVRIQPERVQLITPTFATGLPNGNHLICDGGNRCVYELDRARRVLHTAGRPMARGRRFSFPRSVQYLSGGDLVADSAHDRVVEVDAQGLRERRVHDTRPLFWPRAARIAATENMLVADGRNGRVLEVTPAGRVLRQLDRIIHRGRVIALRDPHDIRLLPNHRLLVVDSAAPYLVFEAGWDGRVEWILGLDGAIRIRDPHSAQMLPDGRVMITDAANHRLLFVDPLSGTNSSVRELRAGGRTWQLNLPKYAEIGSDGTLVVADSGNNRVLVANEAQDFVWELSRVPQSPIPHLRYPRWAQRVGRDEVVVSDYFNHRILHLRHIGR